MKKAIIAVSVLSFAVSQAFAVDTKSTKKSASKKQVAHMALKVNTAAAAAAASPSVARKSTNSKLLAMNAVAAPKAESKVQAPVGAAVALPAATTTAAVSAPAAKKFEPGLKLSWVSLNSIPLKTVQNFQKNESDELDPEVTAWEQPTVSYKFTKTSSFGIMPQFFHTWFGNPTRPQDPLVKAGELKQGATFFMGDIALKLSQKELAKFNDVTISGMLRYDLPTSERTQAANSPGSAWGIIDISKSVGKWDFVLNIWTRFYFQNYLTSTLHDTKDNTLQNPMFRDYVIANVGYNFTKKFSAAFSLGTKDTISYGDEVSRGMKYSNNRLTVLSVSYAVNDGLNFTLGLSEELSMRNQTQFNVPFVTTNDADGGEVYLGVSMTI